MSYDRLLIATGVRNRPWFVPEQAALDGVVSVRTSEDGARLHSLLAERPKRVLVIGGGFTGSEIASVSRQLDLDVTLVERAPAPLSGAFGEVVGQIAAEIQREHGVDLRTGLEVTALEGDDAGRVRSVVLSDGSTVEVDVVVVALGSERNVEWLAGSAWRPDRWASPPMPAVARSTTTAWWSTTCSSPVMSPGCLIRCTGTSSCRWSIGRTRSSRPRSRRTTWCAPRWTACHTSPSRPSGRSSSA